MSDAAATSVLPRSSAEQGVEAPQAARCAAALVPKPCRAEAPCRRDRERARRGAGDVEGDARGRRNHRESVWLVGGRSHPRDARPSRCGEMPEATALCHSPCWSECEKRLSGTPAGGIVAPWSSAASATPTFARSASLPLIEQRLDLGERRMKAEGGVRIRRERGDRQQLRLGKLDAGTGAADGGVRTVAGGIDRHEHIVAVDAAEEEDANERLVVGASAAVRGEREKVEARRRDRRCSTRPYGEERLGGPCQRST